MPTKRKRDLDEDVGAAEDFSPELPSLVEHERTLRCAICSDLFESPVFLTTCSHCFCSKCIRSHFVRLQSDSACPICSVKADDSHLRSAPIVELLVGTWQKARQPILDLKKARAAPPSAKKSKGKGKAVQLQQDDDDDEVQYMGIDIKDPNANVPCPICGSHFKQSKMDAHVTSCLAGESTSKSKNAWDNLGLGSSTRTKSPSDEKPEKYMNRINSTVNSLQEVRSKCQALRLYDPESTRDKNMTKEELIRRHSEYVILHNANQDAAPALQKTPKDLRAALHRNEKVAREAKPAADIKGNGSTAAQAYQRENREMFKQLEEQARRGLRAAAGLKKEESVQEIEPLS